MRVKFSANYYSDDFKPKKPNITLAKKENNARIQDSAEINAGLMRDNPSYLERMMIEFLNNNNIEYEFQKIFYITDKNRCITKYFIADFYIAKNKLIIEVDGKFHEKQKEYDNYRAALIKQHYKKVKFIRFTFNDFKSKKLLELLKKLK